MATQFKAFVGFEEFVHDHAAAIKGVIQDKIKEFSWITDDDDDSTIVDYVLFRLAECADDRAWLVREIQAIVPPDEFDLLEAQVGALADHLYVFLTDLNAKNGEETVAAPASDKDQPVSRPATATANGATATQMEQQTPQKPDILSKTQTGRVSSSRPAGQSEQAKNQVYDKMLNGASARQRPAQLPAQNVWTPPSGAAKQAAADGQFPTMFSDSPQVGVCPRNLECEDVRCRFPHQSPVAPVGIIIDLSTSCPAGPACANRACSASHPSPAQKVAYQKSRRCRFDPNCLNPSCQFYHPSRDPTAAATIAAAASAAAASATTTASTAPGFVKGGPGRFYGGSTILCKFHPCLNPNCTFKHADGQQAAGARPANVWTKRSGLSGLPSTAGSAGAGAGAEAEAEAEELIIPGSQQVSVEELPLQLAPSEDASVASEKPAPAER